MKRAEIHFEMRGSMPPPFVATICGPYPLWRDIFFQPNGAVAGGALVCRCATSRQGVCFTILDPASAKPFGQQSLAVLAQVPRAEWTLIEGHSITTATGTQLANEPAFKLVVDWHLFL
jgi:hypothetical protein